MKKVIVLSAVMLTGMVSSNVFASERTSMHTDSICYIQQEDFTKIEIKDLPQTVTNAVTEKFPESEINEAFLKETEEGKIYKVSVKTAESGEVVLFFNEKGEAVNEA